MRVEIAAGASPDELEGAMQRGLLAAIAGVAAREAGTSWRLLTHFGSVRAPLSDRQCRSCGRHYRPAGRLIAALAGANITIGLAQWCADAAGVKVRVSIIDRG